MIDIQAEVFDTVARAILAEFPNAYVADENISSPPKLPCVCLVERDNALNVSTLDSSGDENHADIMFELDVYSGKLNDRKREARKIAAIADAKLQTIGFVRVMLNPIENLMDSSVYRMKGRYRATVSKNKVIYRR